MLEEVNPKTNYVLLPDCFRYFFNPLKQVRRVQILKLPWFVNLHNSLLTWDSNEFITCSRINRCYLWVFKDCNVATQVSPTGSLIYQYHMDVKAFSHGSVECSTSWISLNLKIKKSKQKFGMQILHTWIPLSQTGIYAHSFHVPKKPGNLIEA